MQVNVISSTMMETICVCVCVNEHDRKWEITNVIILGGEWNTCSDTWRRNEQMLVPLDQTEKEEGDQSDIHEESENLKTLVDKSAAVCI